jgi:hypothetical protein
VTGVTTVTGVEAGTPFSESTTVTVIGTPPSELETGPLGTVAGSRPKYRVAGEEANFDI